MHTSHEKPSMTADPLLLTPAGKAKTLAGESDDMQGLPISMLCCGDGRCGDVNCEGHPDNMFAGGVPVDRKLRSTVMIGLLAWCLVGVLAGIASVGYVVGRLFPGL